MNLHETILAHPYLATFGIGAFIFLPMFLICTSLTTRYFHKLSDSTNLAIGGFITLAITVSFLVLFTRYVAQVNGWDEGKTLLKTVLYISVWCNLILIAAIYLIEKKIPKELKQ